jgi:hypothetical protein
MILLDFSFHVPQFVGGKPRGLGQPHGLKPELCHHAIPLDMDVRWFVSIAAREEETVWPDDSEIHLRILSVGPSRNRALGDAGS